MQVTKKGGVGRMGVLQAGIGDTGDQGGAGSTGGQGGTGGSWQPVYKDKASMGWATLMHRLTWA